MSDAERAARVQLSQIANPGDLALRPYVAGFGAEGALRIIQAKDDEVPELFDVPGFMAWRQRLQARIEPAAVERIMNRCDALGIRVVIPGDAAWPEGVDRLLVPPLALYVLGDASLLVGSKAGRFTFVGNERPTKHGERVTRDAAGDLAADGRVIVAGDRQGVEAIAHRASRKSDGLSVAVFPEGLDLGLEHREREPFDRILSAGGALLSAAPPGATSTPARYDERARLLAGVSGATVITEAQALSDALKVAFRARELGRIVAAFPGQVTSPSNEGAHRLIADRVAEIVMDGYDVYDLPRRADGPGTPATRAPAPPLHSFPQTSPGVTHADGGLGR